MTKSRTNFKLVFSLAVLVQFAFQFALAQNCNVDFPGVSTINYSSTCGGSTTSNLNLGQNTPLGDGDTFTFNSPSVITITGNFNLNAEGSGKIIIPAGVTVNIDGNFSPDPKNSGCSNANPCAFEIVVNGTLHISGNFKNNLANLIWSGSGTVDADKHFDNSNNSCMTCGSAGCPIFDIAAGDCKDDGVGCTGGNFCTLITQCNADATPPDFTSSPASFEVNLKSGCTRVVTWDLPTATDNCTLLPLSSNRNPGESFSKGPTTVTYTATDAKGNKSFYSFVVTVNDTIPPVITGCPGDITVIADASCKATANWTPPGFTDNCTGGSMTPPSTLPGSTFDIGVHPITYTATDASGNTTTCTFNVIVKNEALPVFTNCPEDMPLEADESGFAEATWTPPTASVTCGTVTTTSTHDSPYLFGIGKNEVKYTATDEAGFSTDCIFYVVVVATEIKIEISRVVTPDGDGKNDEWIIANIERFKDNEVTVVDRWGSEVFNSKGYDNQDVVWKGDNRNGHLVPTGTYFYTISIKYRESQVNKKGFIEVIRN